MKQEARHYEADGLSMVGQLFVGPETSPRPGILVFPEAFGLGRHAISRARQLAEMGYVALACDLHGEGYHFDGLQEALTQLQPLTEAPARLRARCTEALHSLLAVPAVDKTKIGAIGFCFGGTMALELARSGADIQAAVAFHAGLRTKQPAVNGSFKARVLACIGGDDPFIPPADREAFVEEMRAAGVDWQLHLYGGTVHSFTIADAAKRNRPEAIRYSPDADRRSWASMRQLFDEVF